MKDIEAAFFHVGFGMEISFGEGGKALSFGEQKVNLHRHGASASQVLPFAFPARPP